MSKKEKVPQGSTEFLEAVEKKCSELLAMFDDLDEHKSLIVIASDEVTEKQGRALINICGMTSNNAMALGKFLETKNVPQLLKHAQEWNERKTMNESRCDLLLESLINSVKSEV